MFKVFFKYYVRDTGSKNMDTVFKRNKGYREIDTCKGIDFIRKK